MVRNRVGRINRGCATLHVHLENKLIFQLVAFEFHTEGCKQGLNLAPLRQKMFGLPLGLLLYAVDFMYFLFIFILQRKQPQKMVCTKPWFQAHRFVHVTRKTVCTKTMTSKPWFCACHKHEKSYKNPSRACVKGGSKYDT